MMLITGTSTDLQGREIRAMTNEWLEYKAYTDTPVFLRAVSNQLLLWADFQQPSSKRIRASAEYLLSLQEAIFFIILTVHFALMILTKERKKQDVSYMLGAVCLMK